MNEQPQTQPEGYEMKFEPDGTPLSPMGVIIPIQVVKENSQKLNFCKTGVHRCPDLRKKDIPTHYDWACVLNEVFIPEYAGPEMVGDEVKEVTDIKVVGEDLVIKCLIGGNGPDPSI